MPFSDQDEDGSTFIEAVFAAALLTLLAVAYFPRWVDLRSVARENVESTTVGAIQVGIKLYGNQSAVLNRRPRYPTLLDEAAIGDATENNPFFESVLYLPLTTDWAKENPLTYRGPSGLRYFYQPAEGTFLPTDDLADSSAGPIDPLGRVVDTFGTIVFYDSGTIVDRDSPMSYLPDYRRGTVNLVLLSGTRIETDEAGRARVTLPNGETVEVESIFDGYQADQLSEEPEAGWDQTSRTLRINRGTAWEGEDSVRYGEQDYSYDPRSRTYSQRNTFEIEGHHSGGSLNTDQGFLYQVSYQTERPTEIHSTTRSTGRGSFEGSTEVDYRYRSDFQYASNYDEGESRYGQSQSVMTEGGSETTYNYQAGTADYQSTFSGWQRNRRDQGELHGPEREEEGYYEYEGFSRSNRRTHDYESETRYRYGDGRDETYHYQYRHAERDYRVTIRDNRSGQEREYHW